MKVVQKLPEFIQLKNKEKRWLCHRICSFGNEKTFPNKIV